jgi:vanillate O-demethylase monooxygenase subunit
MFLRNTWYAAALDREVGEGLFARTVCNEPMVLFRTADGGVAAIEDRCCHRSLPLSLGKRIGDTIQCGYHGLQFDATGRCIKVPGQNSVPPGARVQSWPAVERHGFVWVWLGDETPDEAKIPDMHWNTAPGWAPMTDVLHVKAHHRLVTDNLLDLTHETYIHLQTIGNRAVAETPIKTKRDPGGVHVTRWMLGCEPPPMWKPLRPFVGAVDRWQLIHFTPPANVVIDVGMADAGTGAPDGDRSRGVQGRVINAVTPETETTSWYFWGFPRDFKIDDTQLTEKLRAQIVHTFNEDKAALEAQQASIDRNPAAHTIDINADAGILQSWRLVETMLEKQQPGLGPAAKPFAREI